MIETFNIAIKIKKKYWILFVLILFSCEDVIVETSNLVPFEMSGRAYWALQHVEGTPKARAMLDAIITQIEPGIYENVWVHGKLKDGVTSGFISEDSSRLYNDGVYIEKFYEVGQEGKAVFTFYTQDGYDNRPAFPHWAMWITYIIKQE